MALVANFSKKGGASGSAYKLANITQTTGTQTVNIISKLIDVVDFRTLTADNFLLVCEAVSASTYGATGSVTSGSLSIQPELTYDSTTGDVTIPITTQYRSFGGFSATLSLYYVGSVVDLTT